MSTASLILAPAALPVAASGGVTADFSGETWWLTLLKAVFLLAFLILSVIMVLWVERRGLARMQTRPGPNVNGPFGLLQAIADATKLILKEDFWLGGAEKLLYLAAPILTAFTAFMVYAIIPFGPEVSIFGHHTPLQMADFPVAILYVLAVASFGVYGIILGGWSTHSTYPLLGAVRSAAQVISYELSMSLSILTVFLASATMSTSGIVAAQERMWWGIAMIPSFLIYVVSMVGEVNRLPFDLPEAEGELVAGHMVEYSSMKFAWYFLGEYINMFNVSAVCVTLFLGGWHSGFGWLWAGSNEGWWPMLWFIGKVWTVMFFMIWTRGTLVRIRYDHFMKLGWKFLIPVSLAWFVLVAVVQGYRSFSGGSTRGLLMVLAAVFLVAMLVLLFLPAGDDDAAGGTARAGRGADGDLVAPGEEFDAYAGGYPVPPMPGQELPVSPRARRTRKAAEPARVDAASSIADAVTGSLAETVAGSVAISPPPSDSGSGDTAQEGTDD